MLSRLLSFARLGRPPFLVGGVAFHGLGIAIALYIDVPLDLQAVLWGQATITSIQLMTHFANEYFDLPADLANPTPTRWSGGSRVLPREELHPSTVLASAVVLALLSCGLVLVLGLVIAPGALTLPLLLIALVLGWEYSAPPLRLHSRGLGEVTVALLVPGLTTLVGFYLQTGRIDLLPVLAVVPLCILQIPTMLLVELPDVAGDAATGKRTLVVRLGPAGAIRLQNLLVVIAYLVLPLLVVEGLPLRVAAAASLTAPIAAWHLWRIQRGDWTDPTRLERLAFTATALLMATAGLEFLAFL